MTTSSTTSDSEWQRVTMNDNKRQWGVQRMKANESDFRFQNETIIQCKTTIYSATSFWKYNVLILLKLYGTAEHLQKQPPEVLHKKACSKQFCNFYRKTPESLQLYQKQTPTQVFSCEYCEIFTNTYFEEHLRTAA